ncbi:MAG: DUF488 domain-containing protein [Bacilli bacterium]|nr:DUF488 domain-containing protein [Bacilli bacterium]
MFYRRKIILALLQSLDREIDKISLQKLLFLFTQRQKKAEYDFIPYLLGCYSYSLNADLTAMVKKEILLESKTHFKSNITDDFIKALKDDDKKILHEVIQFYGKMDAKALMKHTYINFPYWAINSIKAKDILSTEELNRVEEFKPQNDRTVLYTIGYEGISLEMYLNRLIKNDIKVLVDVRSNPSSMKYGFSKTRLKSYCSKIGIFYEHFPEVGIQSEQRQELNTQEDYDRLFTIYRENNLKKTTDAQLKILDLLKQYERIALTCFEANICQCHRKDLSEAIAHLPDFEYTVKHI